jgi:VIT1/CCC1 family predicted Fe2+/Mn2+ transporter
VFRQGPFPAFVHGLLEYVLGGLFIALPLVLGYDSGAATAASIVIGVLLIAIAASTDWGMSLNKQIPKPAHFALDWALAGVMIASPFLFGFSGESAPTAIFIAAGVLHVLLTIGTRFGSRPERKPKRPAPS